MVLKGIKPEKVFEYFEKICSIPHGSYNTGRVADFIVEFAKQHGLEYSEDEYNNVVIRKKRQFTDSKETVIIQGHLDMVCTKYENTVIDFENECVHLKCNEDYIFADGTSLGGDDGIAVAMALAVLDDKTISHPALECVFTSDEEVGMLGANAMDMSSLKGKYMLNLDSEEEGIFTVSCAGGGTLVIETERLKSDKTFNHSVEIKIRGLVGGHSGVEINKGRANAIVLMGTILSGIDDYELVSINGGQKENAIPTECTAVININSLSSLENRIKECKNKFPEQYSDGNAEIAFCIVEKQIGSTTNIMPFISQVTNGVKTMSKDFPGLVQTSSNFGVVCTEEDKITMIFSVRSSCPEEMDKLKEEITGLAEMYGGKVSSMGEYPAWVYKDGSELQKKCVDVYKRMYLKEPEICAIHAGLECGIFTSRIEDLECVSLGPDMIDIHTPKERLSIKSTERVYNYLIQLLSEL